MVTNNPNVLQLNLSYFRRPIQGRIRDLKYRAGKRDGLKLINDSSSKNDNKQSTSESDLSSLILETSTSSISTTLLSKRPQNIKKKSLFILDEADVTGDAFDTQLQTQVENSEDREFIDDNVHEHVDHTEDSIYLKTTKNLVGPQNKYKLKFDYDRNLEVNSQRYGSVFSQEPDEEDEYQMDSFCNDDIIYVSDSEDDLLTVKETPSRTLKRSLNKKPISSTPINPIKKRRRIIIDEDDD
ncbi:uncharacterized protein LOC113791659 [Dermatophagoides pteronyssinus]|uniref:uncharacterized protein LOC113791659 n=1 Tax=Dermatophagoides pteronyssinus TaxID=6956 RepID=UPI003F66F17E